MSIVASILTDKQINFDMVFKRLADNGFGMFISQEEAFYYLFLPDISIRALSIEKVDVGYEISLPFLACKEDLEFF